MRKLLLLILLANVAGPFYGQAFNGDPKKSFINIDMPKTPESQGMEKYGNMQVNENTGTPNISIPLFNLRSKFIGVPISLSYNASGIRVDQEASSTGLGFDLIAGGRITVEIKGSLDDNSRWNLIHPDTFKLKFQKIANRLNNGNGKAILTYLSNGTLCDAGPGDCSLYDTMYDHTKTAESMAWYGTGEPDIYNANFMGNSLSFYYDIPTGQLRWLGEKSLFSVSNNIDTFGRVTDWVITDNAGMRYYFYQREKTLMSSIPNGMGISQYETTTAWLLTKILHPTGDSVNFTYTNHGKTYPATTPSSSATLAEDDGGTYSISPDSPKDQAEQNPAYLTKVESSTTKIEMIMDVRDDLKGAGARKVTQIKLTDKIANEIKKTVNFRYSYFTGTLESYHTSLHDSVTKYMKYRLRLDSLYVTDSAISRPYRFYYHLPSGIDIPEKLSFSQDHWGYYNGRGNNSGYLSAGSPSNLIPTKYSLSLESIPYGFSSSLDGYGDRRPSETHMAIMTMDSICYPTGGSTKFVYEPHQTDYYGGGLRVKRATDYSYDSTVAGTTDYLYEEGYYAGVIDYAKIIGERVVYHNPPYHGVTNVLYKKYSLSSHGNISYANNLIGYGKVTKVQKSIANVAVNGKVIKYFRPTYKSGSDCGIEETSAHYPNGNHCEYGQCLYFSNSTDWLFSTHSQLPGTTSELYDGKPIKEEYFDSSNNKLRSVEYFYSRASYSKNIYSLKAFDGYKDGPSVGSFPGPGGFDMASDITVNFRRFLLFAMPAKSYYILTDSIIEKTYQGGNSLTQKKVFTYNSYFQPEFTTSIGSDGSQSIIYTKTPLSLQRPNIPSAGTDDSYLIEQMKSNHIYDVQIETVLMKRSLAGDTTVTGAAYNVYEYGLPQKTFAIETRSPTIFRTGFVPTYYYHNYPTLSSFYLIKDTGYRLQDSALYTSDKSIKEIVSKSGVKSFIWDSTYNTILARCINASSEHIAYGSFETAAKGNWTYSGTPSTDATAPTGAKVYSLAGGNITKTGLSSGKTYIVSLWVKTGATVTVSGGTVTTTTGRNLGDWTYKEYKLTGTTSVTISGSGNIDELRVYPDNALMTSFTHKPLTGVSSQNDPNNRISYYLYDVQQRLVLITDQDKNVLKKICYNYAGRTEECTSPCSNTIANWQDTEVALRCQQDSCGNTGYQEQQQQDMNSCSPTYTQTRWVTAGYNPTTCTPASGITLTYQNNINVSGFTAVYTNSSTSQTYSFSIPTGSGNLGCVPNGTYNITVSKPGSIMLVLFGSGCTTTSGTSATFSNINVGIHNCNAITLDSDL